MSPPTLIFISPHPAAGTGLPNRPASLLSAFVQAGAFQEVIVVNRLRPTAFAAHMSRGRPVWGKALVAIRRRLGNGATLIEHPWPFGRLERRFLTGMLAAAARSSAGQVVVWVADPKSIPAVVVSDPAERAWRVVVDAYDAWDRSPLVRGERRVRAVLDGYRSAAEASDLVFANTTTMRDRLSELGAREVRHLPNACPPLDPRPTAGNGQHHGLVYVGRIHERFDAELAGAVAAALPDTTLTIAGPVEREPAGWPALTAHPNVNLPGRVEAPVAREMIAAAAALIIPHLVDDYTRSQDAMKAWDAIAVGTPVISTPIPPADAWPSGLAEVCHDTAEFVAAARRAVGGDLVPGRADRLAFAAENQWSARAATAVAAIAALTAAPHGGHG